MATQRDARTCSCGLFCLSAKHRRSHERGHREATQAEQLVTGMAEADRQAEKKVRAARRARRTLDAVMLPTFQQLREGK